MAMYSKVEYWNMRYQATSAKGAYEWYQSYKNLRNLLDPGNLAPAPDATVGTHPFPRDDCRILILGCGNSRLGEDLLRDGWNGRIVNIDFSPVVIEQMKARYTDEFYKKEFKRPTCKMEFLCADITKTLPFEDESFDLIISKGSFDAILCSPGSTSTVKKLIEECVRLLKDGLGVFFLVTYGNPDSRVVFLEHDNELSHYWQGVSVHTVPGQRQPNKSDYVYVCRKRSANVKTEGKSYGTENGKMSVPGAENISIQKTSVVKASEQIVSSDKSSES